MNYTLATSGLFRERWAHLAGICPANRVCNLFDVEAGKHLADMPDWRVPQEILDDPTPHQVPRYLYLFDILEGGFVHGTLCRDMETALMLWRGDKDDLERYNKEHPDKLPGELPAIEEPCIPLAIFDTDTGRQLKGDS